MARETPDAHAEIDWAAAEVSGATLTVAFTGDVTKAWLKRFEAVAERLGHGGRWGAVTVKKTHALVEDVAEGAEGDLRHFLESVAQQVNADLAPEKDPEKDEQREEDGASDEDRRMAETFRSFARDDADDAESEGAGA